MLACYYIASQAGHFYIYCATLRVCFYLDNLDNNNTSANTWCQINPETIPDPLKSHSHSKLSTTMPGLPKNRWS